VLAAVAADPGVDVIAAYALAEPDAFDLVAAIAAGTEEAETPLVVGVGGVGPEVRHLRRALLERGVRSRPIPPGVPP
jgi:acetyltransferase